MTGKLNNARNSTVIKSIYNQPTLQKIHMKFFPIPIKPFPFSFTFPRNQLSDSHFYRNSIRLGGPMEIPNINSYLIRTFRNLVPSPLSALEIRHEEL